MNELRPPKTILAPTDFSEPARGVLSHIRNVAAHFGSTVVLLHVLEPYSHPFEALGQAMEMASRSDVARSQLERLRSAELPGINTELLVDEGEAAPTIVKVAETRGADLIVLPTSGYGRFRRFLLGSVAAKVLDDAEMPVLTGVHLDKPAEPGRGIAPRTVVCAVDFDDRALAAYSSASLIASTFGAKLIVVHALGASRRDFGSGPEAEQRAASELRVFTKAPPEIEIVARHGPAAKITCEVAVSAGADIMVIGRSAPGPLGRLRSQSYAIVAESPCAVLSV